MSPPPTRGWSRTSRRRCVAAWRRLPRPRGDGPLLTARGDNRDGVSPAHAGMVPLAPGKSRTSRRVSPAHAGMVPSLASGIAICVSPAHAGMVPSRAFPSRATSSHVSPAHAGMVPLGAASDPGLKHVSPAHAGMVPSGRDCPRFEASFLVSPAHAGMVPSPAPPPTRGWSPVEREAKPHGWSGTVGVSPPPTRGWSANARCRADCEHVSPAHAGMVPHHGGEDIPKRFRLPRPRGDGPAMSNLPRSRADSSRLPRPRGDGPSFGIDRPRAGMPRREAVSPAHAGMVPVDARMRHFVQVESPPPTRGWSLEG